MKIAIVTLMILLVMGIIYHDHEIKEAKMIGFGNGYRCAVFRTFEVPTDCEPVKDWPLTMAILALKDSADYRKFLDAVR